MKWLLGLVALGIVGSFVYWATSSQFDRAPDSTASPKDTKGVDGGIEAADSRTINQGDLAIQTSADARIDQSSESLELFGWRMSRGYYKSGSNDSQAKHAYEYYDEDTLRKLANADDGLAQLILAERLAFTRDKKEEAHDLNWRAAVNGYTAGLTNIAGDGLVIRRGDQPYGFDVVGENGVISDEFADQLKYLSAAEYLGDFVASAMLRAHMEPSKFRNFGDSRARVCDMGSKLADQVLKERVEPIEGTNWPEEVRRIDDSIEPFCIS